jgi:hypothetical protein
VLEFKRGSSESSNQSWRAERRGLLARALHSNASLGRRGDQAVKPTTKMLGIALAASTAIATAAQAQREGYGSTAPQAQPQARGAEQPKEKEKASRGGATVTIGDRKIKVSPAFTEKETLSTA